MTIIATSTTTLRHQVRLVHASTGAALVPVQARLLTTPATWVARTAGDGAVVTTRADLPDPAGVPQLAVTLQPAWWGEVLDFPSFDDQPPRTVVVDLDAPEIEVPVHPAPMRLVVHLTAPTTGDPRTGRTVEAHATSGPNPRPSISLAETDPGVYTSAAVEWTAAFTPSELLVDGDLLRTVSMDFTTSTTSIRLVDVT